MNRVRSFVFPLGTLALFAIAGVACSGGASQPSTSSEDLPQPEAALSDGPSLASEVSIVAIPNASCKLFPAGEMDAKKALTVYADDDGIVHFYAHPAAADDTHATYSLECGDSGSPSMVRAVDLRDSHVFEAIQARQALAATLNRTTLPALSDAEMNTTPMADLLREGYPPRPDAQRQPERYAEWVTAVSRPTQVIAPHAVEVPSRHANPESFGTASNWCGNELRTAGPYFLSDIVFTVPTMQTSPDGGLVVWGGLGGSDSGTNSALIQNGVAINVAGGAASYAAFYEYWRNAGRDVSNFPVRPGDRIEAYAYPTDSNLNWNGVGTYGCFGFNNLTLGTSSATQCMASNSHNPPFTGSTAEFITEVQGSTLPHFPNFTVTGYAWAAGGRVADTSTDPYVSIDMTNRAGATRSHVVTLSAEDERFQWLSGPY